MTNRELKRRFVTVAVLILPAAIVQLTGVYMGRQGPEQAQAAVDDPSSTQTAKGAVKAPTWTARQVAAGAYALSLAAKPMPATPFLSEAEARFSPEADNSSITPSANHSPLIPNAPQFVLQVIMASDTGNKALIDGKAYGEGDEIRHSGWFVESIQPDIRSATLRDSIHGRTMTIMVELPSIKSDK